MPTMFRTPMHSALRALLKSHPLLPALLLAFAGTVAAAQSTEAPKQPVNQTEATASPAAPATPSSAYEDAMRPVEITRKSISNWSPIEKAALLMAVNQAGPACDQFDLNAQSPQELLQLARLCSLGDRWTGVLTATTRYLKTATDDRHTTEVLAMQVDAKLRLKDETGAMKTTQDLIDRGGYDKFVAVATSEMIDNVKFVHHARALQVAQARQGLVLARIAALSHASAEDSTAQPDDAPGLADLYRAAMVLAKLQEAAGDEVAAKATMANLNSTLPEELSPSDRRFLAAEQRRFALLGSELPKIHVRALTNPVSLAPTFPMQGAQTVLLLFPEWCAECARLAANVPTDSFTVEGHQAAVFVMIARDTSYSDVAKYDTADAKSAAASLAPADVSPDASPDANPVVSLGKRPFYTVDAADLDTFSTRDYPIMVVTDANGIVRAIEAADELTLLPGSTMDSAVALVGQAYPVDHKDQPAQ